MRIGERLSDGEMRVRPAIVATVLMAASAACGSGSASADGGGGGDSSGSFDDGATEDATDEASTGDLSWPACAAGEVVGCLAALDDATELCLCRREAFADPGDRYRYWEGAALDLDGDDRNELALWYGWPDEHGELGLFTFAAAADGSLQPRYEATDEGHAGHFFGVVSHEVASVAIIGIDDTAAWTERLVPAASGRGVELTAPQGPASARRPVIGDFDADGLVDLAVIERDAAWTVWTENGVGVRDVDTVEIGTTEVDYNSPKACDLDGDGATDLYHPAAGAILYGLPGTGLDLAHPQRIDAYERGLAHCDDIDDDGRNDLVVAIACEPDCAECTVCSDAPLGKHVILRQSAPRTFVASPPQSLADERVYNRRILTARLTGAGRDVVTIFAGHVGLLPARGDGTFGPPRTVELTTHGEAITAYDVDGDGRDELVVYDDTSPTSGDTELYIYAVELRE